MHADSELYVAKLLDVMMWANRVGRDGYASHNSVYGMCQDAICEIVKTETGIDISKRDWNLGGNSSYLEDVQICIDNERKRLENTIIVEESHSPFHGYKAYFAISPQEYVLASEKNEAIGYLVKTYGRYEIIS